MKQISITTADLCAEELRQINRGTFESGAAAGESVGKAVRRCLEDWGIIDAAWTIIKFLK